MGPRRKLSLAISELREQGGQEREEEGKEEEDDVVGELSSDNRSGQRKSSRPQLMKQPSTELTAAYHTVRNVICACLCVSVCVWVCLV